MTEEDTSQSTLDIIKAVVAVKPDKVEVADDGKMAVVTVYYFLEGLTQNTLERINEYLGEIEFDVDLENVLDTFIYNKPPENPEDPFSMPKEFIPDTREGYIFAGIVRIGLRSPNHLYKLEDALVCLVRDKEGKLSTRYFPRSSVDEATWDKAEKFEERRISSLHT